MLKYEAVYLSYAKFLMIYNVYKYRIQYQNIKVAMPRKTSEFKLF